MSLLRQIGRIAAKDLRLGWRGRSRGAGVVLFGLVVLVLFSFAVGPDGEALRGGASGFLTLALLLSSVLALNESHRQESEDGGLAALLLRPVDPLALFYGKALAATAGLLALAPVLVPAAVVLYDWTPSAEGLAGLAGLWVLVAAGLAAPGTLYAAISGPTRAQDVALPLLLFPLVVPVLLGSVKAMDLVISGDPMRQLGPWTLLLAGFCAIYWAVCGALYAYVVEEI